MKSILIVLTVLLALPAFAQSVVSEEGTSELRILGKRWNPGFFSLASLESDQAQDNGGRLSSYNYLSFHTSVGGGYKFSLRLPFTYGTAGTERFGGGKYSSQELQMQDIILEVRNPMLLFLPWDLSLYWAERLYLPNSRSSKQSGQIARIRNDFILSRTFSRYFEVEAEQKFSYYLQSRTAYLNTFRNEEDEEITTSSLTKHMEYEHWLTAWGKVTPKIGLGLGLKTKDTYYNKSEANKKSKPGERTLSVGPEIRFPAGDHCNFILSYEDKVNRDNDMKELGKFYAKNSEIVLNSWINF